MDFIISIPGPIFLIVYSVYSLVVIFIFKIISLNDYTRKMKVPETTEFDPLELAYLKKGIKGVLVTSIFSLWNKKVINLERKKSHTSITILNNQIERLNEIERGILKFIGSGVKYQTLFTYSYINTIDDLFTLSKNKLIRHNLLLNETIKVRNKNLMYIAILFIILFGAIKLYLGYVRNKPIIILVFLMIFFVFIAGLILNTDYARYTSLGRKFMRQSEQRFKWLKASKNKAMESLDNNLLFGIALFGVAPFVHMELGKVFEIPSLFGQQGWSGGNFFDSDSSSDGSCSGGCSGGCGGGCSGCGGCGGD